MEKVPNGVEKLPKFLTGWVGCMNVTDRQMTDGRQHIANVEHFKHTVWPVNTSHGGRYQKSTVAASPTVIFPHFCGVLSSHDKPGSYWLNEWTDERKNLKQSKSRFMLSCNFTYRPTCLSASASTFFDSLLPPALDVGGDGLAWDALLSLRCCLGYV